MKSNKSETNYELSINKLLVKDEAQLVPHSNKLMSFVEVMLLDNENQNVLVLLLLL